MKYAGLIVVALLSLNSKALAQLPQINLVAENALPDYGFATAIDGEFAAVGSRCKVHIFRKENGEWRANETLPNLEVCGLPGGGGFIEFGYSVALEGNLLVIGAPGLPPQSAYGGAGTVYVYEWDGSSWKEMGVFQDDDPKSGDLFGASVDLHEGQILIGASHSHLDDSQGFVYLFERNGATWAQAAKLTVPDTTVFGHHVSLGKDVLVAAATGVAYVFEKSGEDWIQTQKLKPSSEDDLFFSATSVSVDSGYIAVGARGPDAPARPGAVYLYTKEGDKWVEIERLVPSLPGVVGMGASVSLRGKYLIVGAETVCTPGAVEIFRLDNADGWKLLRSLKSHTPESGKRFGNSVDFDGANLIIGAAGTEFTCGSIVYGEATVAPVELQATSLEENETVTGAKDVVVSVFPNPSSARVYFNIENATPGNFELEIFDAQGRIIESVSKRYYEPGIFEEIWDGSKYADGVYFYRVRKNGYHQAGKMVLLNR